MIPQMEPWFGEEERSAISDYMSEGGWITEFRKTAEFEQLISEFTGAEHCIVVNNGTISLTLAAMACGIEPGDEVLVPDYTMIASPNSLRMFGAMPKFVDVEIDTLCLDINRGREAITENTRAIMLVTANGRYPSCGIEAFEELCSEHGLLLIEDSAQSLGSSYPDGRHMGTAGLVGSFSFSAPKVISTGQGGAIITNDDDIAANVRKLKDFGRKGGGNDIHDSIGFNFKFTDIQACVGIEQMKKLPWRIERKKEIYTRYRENLDNLDNLGSVRMFSQDLQCTTPWFIDALVEQRDALQDHLRDRKIGTRVMYPPINEQKAYSVPLDNPVAKMVGENGLWLPSSSQLQDEQIDLICEAIIGFYSG